MSQRAHGVLTVRSQCFALMTWTQKGGIEQKICVVLWYDVVRCGTSVKPLDPLVWKKAEESAFTFFYTHNLQHFSAVQLLGRLNLLNPVKAPGHEKPKLWCFTWSALD
jgi:hypothetical protein